MDKENPPIMKEKRVLFESKIFRLIEKDMEFASGDTETWEVVEFKGRGGARMAAITNNNEIVFVREYRGAAERYVLRLPTGLIEDGEEPLRAAQRELREETGFEAKNITLLKKLESTSGYYKGAPISIFIATNLAKARETSREIGEQGMEVKLIPLEEAFSMAENAEFEDVETNYAVLLCKKHFSQKM